MRLYLIRHADPDYENDSITPHGHEEAAALAKRMASIGLDRIFSSPLGRAKATAAYTADELRMPISIEEWTCEVSGCYLTGGHDPHLDKGLAVWDTPGEVIRSRRPWPTEQNWHEVDEGSAGPVHAQLATTRRCCDALLARLGYEREDGRYRLRAPTTEKVAIFCHNGTISFLLAHLLEIPLPLVWCGFWHAPTAVTTILFEERSRDWAVPRALCVADTSHLYAAGLEVRPRGIQANYE